MDWRAPTRHFPRQYTGSTTRGALRYHYTKGIHVPKIARDGVLDPAYEVGLQDSRPRVLWASAHPVWEATVCIGIDPDKRGHFRTASFAETVHAMRGVYRIALPPESVPHNMTALMHFTGASRRESQWLARSGRDIGANPADWWGTLSPIARKEWLDVQRWDTERCDWVSVDIEREATLMVWRG